MADEPDIPTPPEASAPAAAADAAGVKGKKQKKGKAVAPGGEINQVNAWVSRMRTYGGLAGFGLVLLLSRLGGVPWSDAIVRGLIGALVLSFIAWWCTLLVFRALIRSVNDTQRELRVLRAQQDRERVRAQAAAGAGDGAPGDTPAP